MQDDHWEMELLCLEIIIPTVSRRVRSKCRGLPNEEQEDIIGDSLEKVVRDARARLLMAAIVNGDASLKGELGKRTWWLTGRAIAEYFRQVGRRIEADSLEAELASEEGEPLRLIDTIADEDPDPLRVLLELSEEAERQERIRRLMELTALLVETQRDVVVMYLQGLPYEQIAVILSNKEGKPVEAGTLRVRFSGAKTRLLQLYRDRYPKDPWLT